MCWLLWWWRLWFHAIVLQWQNAEHWNIISWLEQSEECGLCLVSVYLLIWLMSLFSRQQKWQDDNDRMREKLLSLIGKIGKDARVAKTTTRVSNIYSYIYFSSTNHLTVMQLLVVANCSVHGGFNDVKLIAVIQRRIMKWSYNYGNSLSAQNVSQSVMLIWFKEMINISFVTRTTLML